MLWGCILCIHVEEFIGIKIMHFRIAGTLAVTSPGHVIVKGQDSMSYSKSQNLWVKPGKTSLSISLGDCLKLLPWRMFCSKLFLLFHTFYPQIYFSFYSPRSYSLLSLKTLLNLCSPGHAIKHSLTCKLITYEGSSWNVFQFHK